MPVWLAVSALLASILGSAGLASLLTAKSTARKTVAEARKLEADEDKVNADTIKTLGEANLQLLEPIKRQAADLDRQLEETKAQLETTERELNRARQAAYELTLSLRDAQAETQTLRNQVDSMSKELTAQSLEIERLRGLQHWQGEGR